MNTLWLIRSLIFLVAGLASIFFPKKIYRFQKPVVKMIGLKYNFDKQRKSYTYMGVSFIIISVILLFYSLVSK